ncbi:ATPase, T2SS/T4P/T4SS family [Nautilia lithotrophica]
MANFNKAKEVFRDVVDLKFYVPLSAVEKTKKDLLSALEQKEKMIFITGEAGSGKSMILKNVYNELKDKKNFFYISNPYLEINTILSILKQLSLNDYQIFLIDEAQLLSEETFENLRIYADKGNITIVFATHDTDIKKLMEKKHFQTRINYILKVNKANREELENFIKTKLLKANLIDIAEMLKKRNYNLIYKYTKGSLRSTNQLMFKLFDILDYFYNKNPDKINLDRLSNKYIEMAYMDFKEFHA